VAGWCPSGEDGRVRGWLSDGGWVAWSVDWDFLICLRWGLLGYLE